MQTSARIHRRVLLWATVVMLFGIAATGVETVSAQVIPGVVSLVEVDRIPGVERAVGRSFDSYEPENTAGIGHLEFAVLAFPDADSAQAALPDVLPAISEVIRQDAERVRAPDLGNGAAAWTAMGPAELTVGILLVQEGAYIHVFHGVAAFGNPLDALGAIAMQTVGGNALGSPVPAPAASPAAMAIASPAARPLTSGGLWDLLPDYNDLPGQFGLYTEESWPN